MRTREPDEACAQAVGLARDALVEVAGAASVGEHVGMQAEQDRVVTHLFACLTPAYQGWCWAVTVGRASRSKVVTVNESALLPGPEAILAPEWVPWRERLRPGDLGVGDILPAPADDERLVPYVCLEGEDGLTDPVEGASAAADVTEPLGAPEPSDEVTVLPRARVLSAAGRDDAALRWYTSEHGPKSPLAHAAPGVCAGCGFYVPLSSPLGRVFGVCANTYAPDDGRVVAADHGCGAHSEALLPSGPEAAVTPVIDELGYDLVDRPGVSVEETVFESLDHA